MYNNISFYQRRINYLNSLLEGYSSGSNGNSKWLLSLGEIEIYSDRLKKIVKVEARTFIKVVNQAMSMIEQKYPFMSGYLKHSKRMYLPFNNEFCNTMAVDSDNNLWICLPWVYNRLNFNVDKIFGILFHELMHNFLHHNERASEVLPDSERMEIMKKPNGKRILDMEHDKMNICMDYEVNYNMVADKIVSKDFFTKLKGTCDPSDEGLADGVKVTDRTHKKMWEIIYRESGNILYKYLKEKAGRRVSDRFIEALEAIKKYTDVTSDPNSSQRDIEEAREEMEDALDRLYGATERKRTIKTAFVKLQKTDIKKIRDIADSLVALIKDYTLPVEKFKEEDLSTTLSHMKEFERRLRQNLSDICFTFEIDEDEFKERVKKMYNTVIDSTKKIYDGRDNLSDVDKSVLIDKAYYSVINLVADEMAINDNETERAERERQREEEMTQMRERLRKRHLLYSIYIRMMNIQKLYDIAGNTGIERISDDTFVEIEKFTNELVAALDKKVEELTKDDFKESLVSLDELKKGITKDIFRLFDAHFYTDLTKDDLKNKINETFLALKRMYATIYDNDYDESEKGGFVSEAYEQLGVIGRLITAKKIKRHSDEFKKAYMEEMKRLQKMYKEYGEDAVWDELMNVMGVS